MAGISHLAVGLAAKPLAPKVPVWTLLVASEVVDILWTGLAMSGVENFGNSPISHSLVTALALSALGGIVLGRVFRSARSGAVIAAVIFSHWVIDLITHPMFGGQPDMSLLFEGSPKLGMGLYTALPMGAVTALEIGTFLLGLAVFWANNRKMRSSKTASQQA